MISPSKTEYSCSRQNAELYIKVLVQRYALSYKANIEAWEIGNELNLIVDLDMSEQQPSLAPTLGTAKNRTEKDNFTTSEMITFQSDVVSWIRSIDSNAKLSTGNAIVRTNAWHLRQSYYDKERDWRNDTKEEYLQSVRDQSVCCQLISMHIYPGSCLILFFSFFLFSISFY